MALSMTVEEIAHKLGRAKPAGDGSWYCRCPAHDDSKPSLWIAQRDGGGLNVKCHAGCAQENVAHTLRSMNLWPETRARKRAKSDEEKRHRNNDEIIEILTTIPEKAPPLNWEQLRRSTPTVLYKYKNVSGNLSSFVARWDNLAEGKEIRPISLARLESGKLQWVMKAPPGPYDLYHVDELALRPEARVLLVEGEKAADAASGLFPDHVCLTWRSGASAAGKSNFAPLNGRDVTLWPDADEPGVKAMDEVGAMLLNIGAENIQIVRLPPQLPKGWDVADIAPNGISVTEILNGATPFEPDAIEHIETDPDAARDVLLGRTALLPFVLSVADLATAEVEYREPIVDPFLVTSSLNMMFAPRGVGKTFLSLALATALAQGVNFLGYDVTKQWRTLYFDGEMPLADLKQRTSQLSPDNPPEGFDLIPSEKLFRDGVPINLHDEIDQQRIFTLLRELEESERRPDLLIFDNLSSLSGGVNENDNSELDKLLRFLMALRHMGYAVLLIHHAGKGGDQRGASRREDLLDTVISLQKPPETASVREGAHGLLTFSKVRGRQPVPDELEIWLMEVDGRLEWAFQTPKTKNPTMGLLRAIVEHTPATQAELARIIGISDGRVSQILKKLREADLVEGRELALTAEGCERVVQHFPELYDVLVKQGHLFRDDGIL